jgi:dTDP-4-dehydrorhamnose 3,5-epimerase
MDIAIDLRKESPTFLKNYSVELSAKNHKMIFIPKGFAHGFVTLEPQTTLLYHHTASYQPGHEGGINFQDPLIHFQSPRSIVKISEKDRNYPYLSADFKGLEI